MSAARARAAERPSAQPQGAAREAMQSVLDRLRWRIQCSPLTQRALERNLGFSKGYLSQVLRGHVDLKLNHLLSLLEALEVDPGSFFSEFGEEPPATGRAAELPPPTSGAARPERDIGGLVRLYGMGMQSLDDFERRLVRCERALDEARSQGLLPEAGP